MVKIGEETYTSTGFMAHHAALLNALNQTRYRYIVIPSALRTLTCAKDNHTELLNPPCKEKPKIVPSLLDLKLEPFVKPMVEPLLTMKVEPLLKEQVRPEEVHPSIMKGIAPTERTHSSEAQPLQVLQYIYTYLR